MELRTSKQTNSIAAPKVGTKTTASNGIQFSGWLNRSEGDKFTPKKRFPRLRNARVLLKYFKEPQSRQLLKGMIYHYALPTAVGLSLLTPVGWFALPLTGPTAWILGKSGKRKIEGLKRSGFINAKQGPLEAVTSMQQTWEETLKTKIDDNGKTVLDDVLETLNKTKGEAQTITKEMMKKTAVEREVLEAFVKRQSSIMVNEYNDVVTEMLKLGQIDNVSAEELQQMRTLLHINPNGKMNTLLEKGLEAKHTVGKTFMGKAARPFNKVGKQRWLPKFLKWPFRGIGFLMQSVAVFTKSPTFNRLLRRTARLG